jgi:hypothetical protein
MKEPVSQSGGVIRRVPSGYLWGNPRSMKGASHGESGQCHPLLVQLGQTLHMRLPIMPVQRLDLFRPVLLEPRGIGPVLQQSKLLPVISIDLGEGCKLRFDGQSEVIRIKQQGRTRLKSAG